MAGTEWHPPPPGPGPSSPHRSVAPQPGPGAWAPPADLLGAAHRPGAVPLRPLGLGDMYDAAFRIIRFNPRATVGSAVLVAAVAMAVPVLITAVLTWTVGLSFDPAGAGFSGSELVGVVGSFGSLGLGILLQQIGLVLVTGMVAHVATAAAIGRRLSLGEAWQATRGRRWRLLGLTFLLGLLVLLLVTAYVVSWIPVVALGETWQIVAWGLVSVPLFLCLMCWVWIRVLYLPVPALMLEDVGVLQALGRGFRLTRRQFWRTFGIALLTMLVAQIAGSMLTIPLSLLGQLAILGLGPEYAILGLVLIQALSSVVAAAFVAPFTAAVASLQYLDQRMRKEAYDVELMARSGLTSS